MRFIKIINSKKFTLISIFLFIYLATNLVDGERGLVSYYEKQQKKENLINEKESLSLQLASVVKKNNLLTDNLDLDYLEILYRQKFMVGKSVEKIFKSE